MTKSRTQYLLGQRLNEECAKILCVLGICNKRRHTIPMRNISGGGGGGVNNYSGHHCVSVVQPRGGGTLIFSYIRRLGPFFFGSKF